MFGTIRKHQTWLWAVIITLTIISFVSFLSPNSRLNGGRSSENFGTINGERVSREQYMAAYKEVDLHNLFMRGHWLSEDKKQNHDPERDVYEWLLLTQLQGKAGVHVGEDAAAVVGQQMLRSLEKMGINSTSVFVDQVLQRHGLSVDDFERFLRHFVGIQQLINTYGLSGKLITPQEAQALYDREHQEVAASAVFFSTSNYLASVSVNPDTISEFYSNRIANYIIPERVQVSYVRFNVTNYLAQAQTELSSNLNELVEANYERLGSNYFADAKSPEEAKSKIRNQLIRSQALNEAKRKALNFANVLYDMRPFSVDNIQKLAGSNDLSASVSAPFDREDDPKDLEVGPEFSKAAFALTPDDPYAGPLLGQDGAYVISYNKQLPRETPSLDQVRDKVVSDYKRSQATMQAQFAGRIFFQTLTNGMAQGKDFTNICAEAHLKPMELPPFSISTRSLPEAEDLIGLTQLKQIAFSTSTGKVSNFQSTPEGGMILYVKSKLPVDQAKAHADMPAFLASLRRSRQQEAFEEWFRQQETIGLRDTPVGQPRNPPTMGAAAKS